MSAESHCSKPSFTVDAIIFNRPIRFLIDTGADVSLLPPAFTSKAVPSSLTLTAANNTKISVFGALTTTVSFPQLRRCFEVEFTVADVKTPILGADFFNRRALLIDVKRRRLVDPKTCLSITVVEEAHPTPHIHATKSSGDSIDTVLIKNSVVFDASAMRPTPPIEMKIETTSVPPPAKAYRLSPDKVLAAKTEVEKEVRLGRMVRSSSNYASPFFPVKKADGSWRFVADYTKLNAVTIKDNYTPPRIDDLLARVPPNCVFSKLDLEKAFFQIPLRESDQPKSAVITPFGLYQYTVMPMGLKNASQTLQRYVDTTLSGGSNTIAYCDDILLFTSPQDHADSLDLLLQKLHNAGLVVNRSKSVFNVTEIQFLGHILSAEGIRPSEERLMGIRNFKVPQNVRQVRRFLGMINFYRKFIPRASLIQSPLTALTRKEATFNWTSECQVAFDRLRQLTMEASQIVYPALNDKYVLTTDASGTAVGAVLSCERGPIGFYSQQFKGPELNYSAYDRELTAVFKAVTHFEWLLFGQQFKVRTDHKPLIHMFSTTSKCERRRRQLEFLSTFDLSIEHVAGKDNIVADALSRDKSVDTIQLNPCFITMPKETILEEQESDSAIHDLPATYKSKESGLWRDHHGRLLVPAKYTKSLIDAVHSISHTNKDSTLSQIQLNYTWPGMRKQVHEQVQNCTDCQSAKVTRHVKPPYKNLGTHPKFAAIHVDFVGPLPSNEGKKYLLTIFDRATRWFSAYPTSTSSSEAAASCLVRWISIFGVPEILISDRGAHFEAQLFQEVSRKLGIEKRRTSAYHPSANGAVERQHRRLKEALRAKSENAPRNWLRNLPLVLLGLRNAISEDTGVSAAQSTFGRQLNIPGCIFEGEMDVLQEKLPPRMHRRSNPHVPDSLSTCTHVWILKPGMRPSLTRPYEGPFRVLSRNLQSNYFVVNVKGIEETIPMERLKPAWTVQNFHVRTYAPQSSNHVSFNC